jgi:hypothetical protein
LTPACHLTGGFAFYLWFSPNEHKGDFVVTLGGYNPHFTPQPYYPKVPRLGFNWVVTPELSMKGGMYFALTPTCLMAGGSLEALWKSGNLKAWFNMGANFLIAWKPYHYQGDMYLSFGVSYTFKVNLLIGKITKTISVSLGADLSIWGPDFSGIAHIHLWIISFSISFGSASPNPSQTIPWDEFKNSFLPKPGTGSHDTALAADTRETADPTQTDSICSVKVTRGLIKDLSGGTDNPENINWMVNGEKATLETNSLIPSKKYQITIKGSDGVKVKKENMIYTNIDDLNARNQDFGVGLVGVENSAFHSHHDILIVYEDGHIDKDIQFDIFAILENVPKSLWEKRSPGYDSDAVIKNVLVGFDISPVVSPPDHSLPIEKKNLAFYWQTYTPPPAVTWPAPTPVPGPDQINPMKTMMETINTTAAAMRGDILQILVKNGIEVNTHVDVADIAAEGNDYLLAPPILSYTYWKHP